MIEKIATSSFANKEELIEMLTILAKGQLAVDLDHLKCEASKQQDENDIIAQVNLIFDLLCTTKWDNIANITGRECYGRVDCLNWYSFDGADLILTVDVWDYYYEHTTESAIVVPNEWMKLSFDCLAVEIQEWLNRKNKQELIESLTEERRNLVKQISLERSLNEKRLSDLSAIDRQLEELTIK